MLYQVAGTVQQNLEAIVWWEWGGLVVGQVDVARSEAVAQTGNVAMWGPWGPENPMKKAGPQAVM